MPSDLDRAIARNRAALRSIDRSAMGTLMGAYQDVLDRLNPLVELTRQQAIADGVTTPSELFRLERYQELQRQTAVELERLARLTGNVTTEAQARAVRVALDSGLDLAAATARGTQATATVTSAWTHLPTAAVEDLVGLANNGPLRDLLATFGDVGQRTITDELTRGFALGEGPQKVSDRITKAMDISRNRALTIARTEMLRSSRSAALRNYQENADVLSGWIWSAAHSEDTCGACLAMDGTEHPASEPMDSHVNCRCSPRPWLRDIPMAPHETGEEWLAKQPETVQDAILGKSGGQALRNGEVRLGDFVRVAESPVWGKSVQDGGIGWARMQAGQERRAA